MRRVRRLSNDRERMIASRLGRQHGVGFHQPYDILVSVEAAVVKNEAFLQVAFLGEFYTVGARASLRISGLRQRRY